MANWQASLLMQTLSTGTVLVLQRDKTDAGDVPTLHGGDTFYGSLPDGDPFGGTVMERHGDRVIVEGRPEALPPAQGAAARSQRRRVDRPAARILGRRLEFGGNRLPPQWCLLIRIRPTLMSVRSGPGRAFSVAMAPENSIDRLKCGKSNT